MTLYHSTGIIAASGGAAKPGMVLLKPTSVDHSGTSASIGANGQVTFTAVTSLSLNGVFTTAYDNYLIVVRSVASAGVNIGMRMRGSGADDSGANYTYQVLNADSTSVTGARSTSQTRIPVHSTYGTQRAGDNVHVYGPRLVQPTAVRSVSAADYLSAFITDVAGTHNQSVGYDGFTLITGSAITFTGALQVYGVRS